MRGLYTFNVYYSLFQLHFPFWARWTCALDPKERSHTDINKLVALLRGMKSFNKFSRHAQWQLCRTMTYARLAKFFSTSFWVYWWRISGCCRYEKRRIIIRQGHPGFCFYFIVSGTVSVTVSQRDLKTGIHLTTTVDVLEKNDSFGVSFDNKIPRVTRKKKQQKTQIWRKKITSASPGGLEPPTFRLTAERANRLRHGDFCFFRHKICRRIWLKR